MSAPVVVNPEQPEPGRIRKAIETLAERADYLRERISQDQEDGARAGWKQRELAAIETALPILDQAWDAAARAWREQHPKRPPLRRPAVGPDRIERLAGARRVSTLTADDYRPEGARRA